jgi:hypothetical protein
VFGFNIGGLITDWWVENINHDVIPYGVSIDVTVSSKKTFFFYIKNFSNLIPLNYLAVNLD